MSSKILERWPLIERPHRGNGSLEAIERCLTPIRINKKVIREILNSLFSSVDVEVLGYYPFQSRVCGTCKPESDIDIYVHLDHKYVDLIQRFVVPYKDTGHSIICDVAVYELFKDQQEKMAVLKRLNVDLFIGLKLPPPAKREYVGLNYWINLENI